MARALLSTPLTGAKFFGAKTLYPSLDIYRPWCRFLRFGLVAYHSELSGRAGRPTRGWSFLSVPPSEEPNARYPDQADMVSQTLPHV